MATYIPPGERWPYTSGTTTYTGIPSTPGYTSSSGIAYRGGAAFGRVPRVGVPSFSFRFQANTILRLVRDIEGKFQPANGTFMRAVEQANLQMAMVVQAGMVEELQRKVEATGRPQAARYGKDGHKQGALAAALRDPGNRFANASGFVVGRPEYLNTSPAKRYWRRIEEGAPAFKARGWFFPQMSVPGTTAPRQAGQFASAKERAGMYRKNGQLKATGKGPFAPSSDRYRMDARFPQSDSPRAFMVEVGPFPAYRYSHGGREAFQRVDVEAVYTTRLALVGIRVTPRMVRTWDAPSVPVSG